MIGITARSHLPPKEVTLPSFPELWTFPPPPVWIAGLR